MNNVVYIKDFNNYIKTIKLKNKVLKVLYKVIFLYKNIFNIITNKECNGYNICILPINNKYNIKKIDKLIKKISKYENNIYLFPETLINSDIYQIIKKYELKYFTGKIIKKILIMQVLEYINKIQNNNLNDTEVTLLVNKPTELNIFLIEQLARKTKNLKIVSLNFYKFKKIEEKLYKEEGIAIQFSNSYNKSLAKSKIIINLDFNTIDVNEYTIYNNSIIINCSEDEVKIKSKLFEGIVINSYSISFNKELIEKFKNLQLYDEYNLLKLYESIIGYNLCICDIDNKIKDDKVIINALNGNNGKINKKELKNVSKKHLTNNKKQSNI